MSDTTVDPQLQGSADDCVLMVDDDASQLAALKRILRIHGYTRVHTLTDLRDVVATVREVGPDLILLDLNMPFKSGIEVMSDLVRELPEVSYIPILALTGSHDPDAEIRALRAGANDFIRKPVGSTELLLRIKSHLKIGALNHELSLKNERLEQLVQSRTRDLAEARIEVIRRLARAAEYRDDLTGEHTQRVGHLSAVIAEELGFSEERVRLVRLAAPLHDVGKIGVPDGILLKQGPLTESEREVMRSHALVGAEILAGSNYPLLELAETIARTHHERWDGFGYPAGLAGEAIPLEGRVVAVADAFDAMVNTRPYRYAMNLEHALAELRAGSGTQFDPRVAEVLPRLIEARDPRIADMLETLEAGAERAEPDGPEAEGTDASRRAATGES